MSHYKRNITRFVLHYTLFRFLWFPSFGRILHIQLFLFCSFISLWLSFLFRLETLCLHKTSKLMEFTNFWNSFVYLFTSSLLDGGHLTPAFVIPFLRVSLCLFSIVHSLIRCSVLWEPIWQEHVGSSNILNLWR